MYAVPRKGHHAASRSGVIRFFCVDKPWVYLPRIFQSSTWNQSLGSHTLRSLLQHFIHAVRHVLEDRGGGEDVEAGLRRDAWDGVEPGNDAGKLADEGDDLDRFVHAGGGMSNALHQITRFNE